MEQLVPGSWGCSAIGGFEAETGQPFIQNAIGSPAMYRVGLEDLQDFFQFYYFMF